MSATIRTHFVVDTVVPDASPGDATMKKIEQDMQDPAYVSEAIAAVQHVARKHAQAKGHTGAPVELKAPQLVKVEHL